MRVTYIRDYPRKGWESIDVYADNIVSCMRPYAAHGITVRDFRTWPWLANRLRNRDGIAPWLYQRVVNPLGAYLMQGDVTHIVCQSDARMLYLLDPDRTVISVHDILSRWYRSRFHGNAYLSDLEPLRTARHIIAISPFVKSELVSKFGIDPAAVTVIPDCIEPYFVPSTRTAIRETKRRLGLPDRYVLYVGSVIPHKNIPFLLKIFAGVLKRHPDLYFVKAGAPFTDAQKRLIGSLGIAGRVICPGFLDHRTLPPVYSGADLYLQASITEGFGLPILEAMSCGTTAVVSDIPLFRDLFEGGAQFYDLKDPPAAVRLVDRLLDDIPRDASYRRRALHTAQRYRPDTVAAMLKRCYEGIAAESGRSRGSVVRYAGELIRQR